MGEPTYRFYAKGLLLLAKCSQVEYSRLGIIVSKKNLKLATKRNNFKRVIREYFRLHQIQLPPLDIVMIARRGCGDFSPQILKKQTSYLWKKLRNQCRPY